MFEVEKKIILTVDQLKDLKKRALLLEKQKIKDVYFDTDEYVLTLSNKWLRKRHIQLKNVKSLKNINQKKFMTTVLLRES